MNKQCKRCFIIKLETDFPKPKSKICRRCHQDKKNEWEKNWRKTHTKESNERTSRWRKKHPQKAREIAKKAEQKRRKTINGAINHRVGNMIRRALGKIKCGESWQELVGYTVEELKIHLINNFREGMTWEKFLNAEIHIDHIIPQSYFKFKSPKDEEFKKCWALSNLRPLWAKENQSKTDKLPNGIRNIHSSSSAA